ncbi:MAG: HEAT repeat domain-containing protein [Blastocatellia bacterium]|nr:HEAT repeat domain-containing protein [Blastocatellia bacterium]
MAKCSDVVWSDLGFSGKWGFGFAKKQRKMNHCHIRASKIQTFHLESRKFATNSKTMRRAFFLLPLVLLCGGLALHPLPVFSQSKSRSDATGGLLRKRPSGLPAPVVRLDEIAFFVSRGCSFEIELVEDYTKEECFSVVEAFLQENLAEIKDQDFLFQVWRKAKFVIETKQLEFPVSIFRPHLKMNGPGCQLLIFDILKNFDCTPLKEEIVALLESSEPFVHKAALESLIKIGAKEAIPPLIKQLSSSNSNERQAATKELVRFQAKEALPELVKLFADPEPNLPFEAVDAVVKLDGKQYVPQLWQLAQETNDKHLHLQVLVALAFFEESKVFPLILERLIIKFPSDPQDEQVRSEVVRHILTMHAMSIAPVLIRHLENRHLLGRNENEDYSNRQLFMRLLFDLEARTAVPTLIAYLHDNNQFLAGSAAEILGSWKVSAAVDVLVMLTKIQATDRDQFLAKEAARALAKIGNPRGLPALLTYIQQAHSDDSAVVIVQLNNLLDPALFQKVATVQVKRVGALAANQAAVELSRNSGIPIVLSGKPLKLKPNGTSSNGLWPEIDFWNETTLFEDLERVLGTIGNCNHPFTYIMDNGAIRIMPVEDAKKWISQKYGSNSASR